MRAIHLCLLSLALCVGKVQADEVTIAVAANFLGTARALCDEFEAQSGSRVVIVSGSTGQLYAQIINGAPYDVFLAADQERPRLLADSGLGDPASVFSYAIGRLVLWSRQPELVAKVDLRSLGNMKFRRFAIANPDVAPYGAAAKQALEVAGSWASLGPRLVTGQNVAQAFAMIETGNAELGLVALSQARAYSGESGYEIIEDELHEPIRQDAILLRRASDNVAASDFLRFLKSPATITMIESRGYLAK